NLAVAILADPERSFRPCEARVTAAGRGDRCEHAAGLRIDLLDVAFGDLKQMLAVERRARMRGNRNRARRLTARRIKRVELVAGSEPDVPAVIGDPIDAVDARKGSI